MHESKLADLEARVSALEQAISELRPGLADSRIAVSDSHPFRIHDALGNALFEVRDKGHDRSVAIFNSHGTEVANFGCDGTGAGFLALRDGRGALLAYITIEENGGMIMVSSKTEDSVVSIYSQSELGSGINIVCPNGEHGIVIGSGPIGGQLEVFRADTPYPLVTAGAGSGGGVLTLRGASGEVREIGP